MNSNPVFTREMTVGSRSIRTSFIIAGFNIILAAFVLISMTLTVGSGTMGMEISYAYFLDIFRYVAAIELGLIILIVPAMTAGAVSGERERHTLDLAMTTMITPLDVIAGKLEDALISVLVVVVSSFPILALVLSYGGVTVLGLLMLLVIYLITALLCGCIGMAVSSRCTRTSSATVITYAAVTVFFIGIPAGISLLARAGLYIGRGFYGFLLNPVMTFAVNIMTMTGSRTAVQDAAALFGCNAGVSSLTWTAMSFGVQLVMSVLLMLYAASNVLPRRKKNSRMIQSYM